MKIAIINDTHFGARNDSKLFLDYFLDFFENQFFPYLERENITTIFHLGDLMDRRKYVNFHTLSEVRYKFFNKLKKLNITMHMILGNHDTYYKNTNEINSANELFYSFENFYLYEKPQTIVLDDIKFALLPWICDKNKEESISFIEKTSADILLGHLELDGYELSRGVKYVGGMKDELFGKYEMVLSGHFHNKSSNKNIRYLGTQYEITFSDAEEEKGFHVFDTKTRALTFVKNPNKMFYVIRTEDVIDDYSIFKNKYVKLLVTSDKNYDNILYEIENSNPYELNIIESVNRNLDVSSIDLSKDTLSIINEEIDNIELEFDKNILKKIMNEIYLEALSI